MTQGILAQLRRQGVAVPQQISVISMDHSPAELDPRLDVAYVDGMIEEVCALAMQEVELQLGGERAKTSKTVMIPTTFHAGESIGPIAT